MKRSTGELVRLAHALDRMAATVESIKARSTCVRALAHPSPDDAQAVLVTAGEIAMLISKFVACQIAERDAELLR